MAIAAPASAPFARSAQFTTRPPISRASASAPSASGMASKLRRVPPSARTSPSIRGLRPGAIATPPPDASLRARRATARSPERGSADRRSNEGHLGLDWVSTRPSARTPKRDPDRRARDDVPRHRRRVHARIRPSADAASRREVLWTSARQVGNPEFRRVIERLARPPEQVPARVPARSRCVDRQSPSHRCARNRATRVDRFPEPSVPFPKFLKPDSLRRDEHPPPSRAPPARTPRCARRRPLSLSRRDAPRASRLQPPSRVDPRDAPRPSPRDGPRFAPIPDPAFRHASRRAPPRLAEP